jgi:GNAT superfamily N-acetyltransferase
MNPTHADMVTIRTSPRPGDEEAVVRLHGRVYSVERGFDATFESYVAGPLGEFARRGSSRERLWLAERGSALVGCVAVVAASESVAQLRWFLVAPEARGAGLGRRLLAEALDFAKAQGYDEMVLWTESVLHAAAKLYLAAGFRLVEEKPTRHWGVEIIEQKYSMPLR